MTIVLVAKTGIQKRVWEIDEQTKGLRYGENPDQPAAMYQLEKVPLNFGGIEWRGPGNALVSALNEEHMIQAGKHPGKTNLTDVDNGANIPNTSGKTGGNYYQRIIIHAAHPG